MRSWDLLAAGHKFIGSFKLNISANFLNALLLATSSIQLSHSFKSFSGYFFKQLEDKKINRILLIATGALMNSTSSQQGESIPGIAHAISIEM